MCRTLACRRIEVRSTGSVRPKTEEHEMDTTFPGGRLTQLITAVAGLATRPTSTVDTNCAEMVAAESVGKPCLAPMQRRELRSTEIRGADFLRAGIGPIGPYLGVLRR